MPHSNKQATKRTSLAKVAGLKSTFVVDNNELLITSFGKGNIANPEYTITKTDQNTLKMVPYDTKSEINNSDNSNDQADDKSDNHNILLNDWSSEDKKATYKEIINIRQFNIESKRVKAEGNTVNPIFLNQDEKKHMDQIGLRDKLEEYYFGETFDDNIHIQIAYCINDIEKMLAFYINDIAYSINNIIPEIRYDNNNETIIDSGFKGNDLLGSMSYQNPFFIYNLSKNNTQPSHSLRAFKELINNAKVYGINVIMPQENTEQENTEQENTDKYKICLTEEQFYYLVNVVGYVRQCIAHNSNKNNLYCLYRFRRTTESEFGNDNNLNALFKALTSDDYSDNNLKNNLIQYFKNYICSNFGEQREDEGIKKWLKEKYDMDDLTEEIFENILSQDDLINKSFYFAIDNSINTIKELFDKFNEDNVDYNTLNSNKKKEHMKSIKAVFKSSFLEPICKNGYIEVLNNIYNYKIENINMDFLNNSQINIAVILSIFDEEIKPENISKETLISEFYNFIIKKDYKYIGVSIKKLREYIIGKAYPNENSSNYNNISINRTKNKINLLTDFMIFHYYMHDDSLKNMIDECGLKLRMCIEEKNKDDVYAEYGEKIYKYYEKIFTSIIEKNNYFNYDYKTFVKKFNLNDNNYNKYNKYKKQIANVRNEIINKLPDDDNYSYIKKLNDKRYKATVIKTIDMKLYNYYKNMKSPKKNEKILDLMKTNDNYDYSYAAVKCLNNKGIKTFLNEINSKVKKVENDEKTIINSIKDIKSDNFELKTEELFFDLDYDGLNQDNNYRIFCHIIYAMTLFLDGKEINELLTKLSNKFDNIASFLDVINNKINDNSSDNNNIFKEEYQLFEKSKEIAEELRFINSFARMNYCLICNDVNMKKALKILGCNQENTSITDNKKSNFIINNVIRTRSFMYITRYANMDTISNIIKNRSIVELVINNIPDEQIDKYYNSIKNIKNNQDKQTPTEETSNEDITLEKKKICLVDCLHEYSYDSIIDNNKGINRSVVKLYLTVLYLTTKNIVNINSRYFIGVDSLIKDYRLKGKLTEYEINNTSHPIDYYNITKEYIDSLSDDKINNTILKNTLNSLVGESANHNKEVEANKIYVLFRNCIEHLSAVRLIGSIDLNIDDISFSDIKFKRWFDLYQYIIQVNIFKNVTNDNNLLDNEKEISMEYLNKIKRYKKYSKDALKAMCLPFAYNLPRYKNLTTERLFDMNR